MPTKKKAQHERVPLGTKPGGNEKGKRPITGDGRPLERPNTAHNEALIELIDEMLAMRKKRWEIRKAIELALGRAINYALFDRLIAAAQRHQIERYKQDKDIHLGNAQAFYENAIREAPDWRDKLAAQSGINAIHGLNYDPKAVGKQLTEDERLEQYKNLIDGLKSSTANDTTPIADDDEV